MRLIDADVMIDILRKSHESHATNSREESLLARDIRLLQEQAKYHPVIFEQRLHREWIPVEERLPEKCENVLAWIERDAWKDGSDYPVRTQEAAIGWHIEGRWHFDGYAGSTTKCLAWMPLPEPYEAERVK